MVLLLTAAISGCQSIHQQPQPTAGASSASVIDQWQLEGKLGFKTSDSSGSATIRWRQEPSHYSIRISGPLGQGAVEIESLGNQISLTDSRGRQVSAASAEELLQQSLGWQFPISELHYWVRGLPSPEAKTSQELYGERGELLQLRQQAWGLGFSKYTQIKQWLLPSRITATRDEIRLTLVIKQWNL